MDDLKKDLQDENPALPPLPPIPEEPKKIPDAPINPPAQKEEEKYSPLRSMEYGGSLISHPQGDIEVIWPYGPKFATPPDYPPVDPPIDPPIIPPILPPIGPPGTPELPPDPPIAADSPPLKGEICCVGFNPENSMFEAIITIDRRDLFGAYCGSGTVAHVGFWLKSQPLGIWPPDPGNLDGFKFIGESTLRVYGADGGILGGGGPPKYAAPSNLPNIIHYAIHHKLPPEMVKFIPLCDNVNLPQLHCVLTFTAYDKIFKKKNKDGSAKVTIIGPNDNPANVLTDFAYRSFAITNKNYKGIGLKWAATQTVDIQFPKKSARGNWQYLERASQEAKTIPIHAIQLRNKKILM
ncbi:MAG TPA: hypothetical protein VFO76_12115, partial [Candidatus Kapabacteria bacterium]|nr:hypothetical protein [Candidatus Kapabacteria bacterium]